MSTKTSEFQNVRKQRRAPDASNQADTKQDDTVETVAERRFIASEILQGGVIGAVTGVAWGSFLGLFLALQMQAPNAGGWDTVFISIGLGALIGAIASSVLLMVVIKVGSGIQRYFAK